MRNQQFLGVGNCLLHSLLSDQVDHLQALHRENQLHCPLFLGTLRVELLDFLNGCLELAVPDEVLDAETFGDGLLLEWRDYLFGELPISPAYLAKESARS